MNKTRKILFSLLVVGVVAGLVGAGTTAFFSDTETSKDNVLQAGAIDLKIDNHSWYNGRFIDKTSWELTDLTIEKFFDFHDLKPGDWGEDTISIHVDNNRAWACANVTLTSSHENERIDPEKDDGDTTFGKWEGELDEELNFVFWADDGDNVYECDKRLTEVFTFDGPRCPSCPGYCEPILMVGKPSELPQGDENVGATFALADSTGNLFQRYMPKVDLNDCGENDIDGLGCQGPRPLSPKRNYYIGKYWCYGEIEPAPLVQDYIFDGEDPEKMYNPVRNPGNDGSGFYCNGEPVTNVSQTDRLTADISFYAVQARHNRDFVCGQEERDLTSTDGKDWPEITKAKDWLAKARYGANNPTGSYELEIGYGSMGNRDEGDHVWGTSPSSRSFTLTYDSGSGNATLTVDGSSVTYPVSISGTNPDVAVIVKTHGANGDGTSAAVSNLKLDGISPVGPTGATATTSSGVREIKWVLIEGDTQLDDGFTLTGDLTFTWNSNPKDEGPAMEIIIEDLTP